MAQEEIYNPEAAPTEPNAEHSEQPSADFIPSQSVENAQVFATPPEPLPAEGVSDPLHENQEAVSTVETPIAIAQTEPLPWPEAPEPGEKKLPEPELVATPWTEPFVQAFHVLCQTVTVAERDVALSYQKNWKRGQAYCQLCSTHFPVTDFTWPEGFLPEGV